jgi:hypothetical protein
MYELRKQRVLLIRNDKRIAFSNSSLRKDRKNPFIARVREKAKMSSLRGFIGDSISKFDFSEIARDTAFFKFNGAIISVI